MIKTWRTIYRHRDYDIKILDPAEMGDDLGYKVEEISDKSFPTLVEAMKAIDDLYTSWGYE
jgi:hypothetical protein